jgi:hypothetical protein
MHHDTHLLVTRP